MPTAQQIARLRLGIGAALLLLVTTGRTTAQGDEVAAATPSTGVAVLPPAPKATDADEDPAEPASTDLELPGSHHPWARFAVGAWRNVRTTTESFDTAGQFVSRSETERRETLVEIASDRYTLEVSTTVLVGGKRLRSEDQRQTMAYITESPSEVQSVEPLEAALLQVSGKSIRCQRWRITSGKAPGVRTETYWYSPDLSPYVLQVESVTRERADASAVEQMRVVTDVDVPLEVDKRLTPGWRTRVVTSADNHRVETTELGSPVVPGGLVHATTTERDPTGRRVRWSVSEVTSYGQAAADTTEVEAESEPPPLLRRLRLFRRQAP